MRLKEISATYGRKVNLGDYNSQHVEITLWAELEDGDDLELAANGLRQMDRNQVMAELAIINEKLAEKAKGVFLGLPASVRSEFENNTEVLDRKEIEI